MLKIQDITVTYGKEKKPVLKHFSLDVQPGEICSLVGESGSGKTTVIRAVHGTLPGGGKVSEGSIRYKGEDLLSYDEAAWSRLRGSEISMIFQDSGAMMNPIRTIGSQFCEYIMEHEKGCDKKEAWHRGIKMLEQVRLPDGDNIMKSYPFQLSGGMRQRVGIAFAMAFHPTLLLADEPTSALDVTTQAQIVRLMMNLRKEAGTAIVVITHNLALAAYMSDQIVVMKNGEIVDRGDRDKILKDPDDPYTKKLLGAVPVLGGDYYV
ncbi:MAG: ABC transporter ATP-binding protein [Lachnospiraceae bacterium]|jgi:peptide/nickel transport system ATP-binding protein|nr:ABC transporter ATP-binding protein [Lachnospiraceae bacterium]